LPAPVDVILLSSARSGLQLHEGARRRQTVTCTTLGRDVASFVDAAKKQVAAKVNFPAGTYACRPPGAVHGPFKSIDGCLLYETHYYQD